MIYDLPTKATINCKEYEIYSDYRDILDICMALNDAELSEEEKAYIALCRFYVNPEEIPEDDIEQALKECMNFISCGEDDTQQNGPKLMDWEQDFRYIVSPVNRIMGTEIRSLEYLHWYSFISAYYEIGECLFSNIVRIRDAKARGKKLSKEDNEWYRKNANIVNIKQKMTDTEEEFLKKWV